MSGVLEYGFSLGRVYVLEEKLLSQNEIERLYEATKFSEMVQVLAESDYSYYLKAINSESDIEEILDNYLHDLYSLVDELGNEKITMFFRYKYDDANMRSILSGGAESRLNNFGIIDPSALLKLVGQKNYKEIADILYINLEDVTKLFAGKEDDPVQLLTFIYYKKLRELAKESNFLLFKKVTMAQIDIENIRLLFRNTLAVSTFISGGNLEIDFLLSENARVKINEYYPALTNTGNNDFAVNDKDLDNILVEILNNEKYKPLNKNRVFAYLFAKELEVKNIRTLLLSGLNSYQSEEVEMSLRKVYA